MHNMPSSFKLPSEKTFLIYPTEFSSAARSSRSEPIISYVMDMLRTFPSLFLTPAPGFLRSSSLRFFLSLGFTPGFYIYLLTVSSLASFSFVSLPLWEPVDVDMMAILKWRDQML